MKSNYPAWPLIKFVLTVVVLGLLAQGWFRIAHNATPHPYKANRHAVTVKSLSQRYADIDHEYFNDKLLNTSVEMFHNESLIGQTICDDSSCTILVNPQYNLTEVQADMTLFHETCHVATYKADFEHGRPWQACMYKLALQGAFEKSW